MAGAWGCRLLAAGIALTMTTGAAVSAPACSGEPRLQINGINLIRTENAPFGSPASRESLARLAKLGADNVAIVPFLWQPGPDDPQIGLGSDMSLDELRVAIAAAQAAGLDAFVKPHVWVPETWAGAIAMPDDAAWATWFGHYRTALIGIAQVAADAGATSLAIGTELVQSTDRPEWPGLIAEIRAIFPGTLVYVAHNADEAETVPFWAQLDRIGVSLYPPLGADDARQDWAAAMADQLRRIAAVSRKSGRKVWVAEYGLRSAVGAAAKPWESAEERDAAPDDVLQATVIAEWHCQFDPAVVEGAWVWRWFTDPDAGGRADTDFTVQGKLTEGVLFCHWRGGC